MSSAPAGRPVSPRSSWVRRHGRGLRWATAWVPIAVVALLLIALSDLVPVSLSGMVTTTGTGCVNCPAEIISIRNLPARENMTVRWTDISGGVVGFRVWWNAAGESVLSQTGGSGAGSFESLGGDYTFSAYDLPHVNQPSQQVDYTVTYYTSLL